MLSSFAFFYYLEQIKDGKVLYKKEEGTDVASDTPTKNPQKHVANTEPSINSISQNGGVSQENSVKLPNGLKPDDIVTVMEDDGSLRMMTAEDAAAEGRLEPKSAKGVRTGVDTASEAIAELKVIEDGRKLLAEVVRSESGVVSEKMEFSIVRNFKDMKGNIYDSAVLLDTNIFDGISPRDWWKKLKSHLEERIAKDTVIMPIFDENGNKQLLQFAKTEERVNNHPVNGELYKTKDNISKLSVVHIDEIIEVSEEKNPYFSNSEAHSWLDDNGWLHRTAYVINNKNDAIYEISIDIAKTRDGRVLMYSLSGKTKRIGDADVSSFDIQKAPSKNSYSNNRVPQNNSAVNSNSMQKSEDDADGNRTSDNDFTVESPVEVKKDLVAVHNLSAKQLLEVLKRGAFNMPSIAVTNEAHSEFGEISIAFYKDTIDPMLNPKNMLFGSDAWTPAELKIKMNPVFNNDAVSDIVGAMRENIGRGAAQILGISNTEFKNAISKAYGSIYLAFSEDVGFQAAAQAKADYVTQNAELVAKGKINFIDGAINTAPRIVKALRLFFIFFCVFSPLNL